MRAARIITWALNGSSGMELSGLGMGSARVASVLSVMICVAAAPAGASSRATPRETPSFTLNAAASLGSKWGSVTSTTRTRQRNYLVGGAPNSFHLTGRAIDIARRPGVRHADIEASYRKAGFVLIESLDEGDHSHFAFGAIRSGALSPVRAELRRDLKPKASSCSAAAKAYDAALSRRRPDRNDDCAAPEEAAEANSGGGVDSAAFE